MLNKLASSQGELPELTDLNNREMALSELESPKNLQLKTKMRGDTDTFNRDYDSQSSPITFNKASGVRGFQRPSLGDIISRQNFNQTTLQDERK